MVDWVAVAAIVAVLALQTVWIHHAPASLGARLDRFEDRVEARFDQVGQRFDRIEASVLKDHGERIARLEAQMQQE